MKRNPSLILLASIAVIIGALGWNLTSHANSQSRRKGEGAIMATESKGLANYDIRLDQAKESRMALESYRRTLSAQQVGSVEKQRVAMVNAKASLAARVPALQVSVNNALNTTEIVGVEGSPRFLTAPSSEKHEIIARNFLTQNAALYGLSATQAAQLKKIADYANPAGNLSFNASGTAFFDEETLLSDTDIPILYSGSQVDATKAFTAETRCQHRGGAEKDSRTQLKTAIRDKPFDAFIISICCAFLIHPNLDISRRRTYFRLRQLNPRSTFSSYCRAQQS
jgi:hypothetical protein